MKKQRLIATSIGLAVLSLAVWQLNPSYGKEANVQSGGTGDQEWGRCLSAHLKKRLFALINPSKEQEDQLSTLFGEQYEKNQELRTQLKQKTLAMVDGFGDDSITNEQLKQQAAELRTMHERLMDSRMDAALKARSVLTASQKKMLAERIKTKFDGWLLR